MWVYREWIRQSVAQNKPYDQFARELITAQGSSLTNPAVNYYRTLKDRDDAGKLTTNKITEDVSQTFLGVRFNCNKCHDHPFERWTQAQYYEFGAYFARVAFKPGQRAGRRGRLHQLHRRRGHSTPRRTWRWRRRCPTARRPTSTHARVPPGGVRRTG